MSVGKNGAIEGEAGAHVRSGAVAACSGAGEEGERSAKVVALPFGRQRGVVKDAQNGAIRDRAKSPLPVVIVGKVADGAKLHHAQQRTQGNVDIEGGAGTQANFLAQGRKERRSSNFESVEARQQAGGGVESGAVSEYGEGAIGSAQDL